ncbi:protein-L-isoaspartate O-methyltransferase [Rhodovarius sp.]|uniref:protein-L-isoaspartate O-methyltransferase family protein n=1 Tax=Rhodovarius sp. TaxID=2972673 RepID=UPI0034A59313
MAYAAARKFMVDGQLRPNKVTDPLVLAAMARLEREAFVPAAAQARAYADEAVPLAPGRAMMAPMILARLLQAAAARLGESALVVGAGSGYAAAVLADLGTVVTALEEDGALLAIARQAWPVVLPGAVPLAVQGPLALGYAASAPYQIILIDGAVPALPEAIAAQLAEGGRVAMVQTRPDAVPQAVLGTKLHGKIFMSPVMDATAPALPGFAPAPSFVF